MKVRFGNQEGVLVDLRSLSLIWFHLYKKKKKKKKIVYFFAGGVHVVQISVNCTILFHMELIVKYPIIGLEG